MDTTITADDLWPIIQKLPQEELARLVRLARRAATGAREDLEAYQAVPPSETEFGADEDSLSWEGEGWEEFYAAR